MCLDKIDSKPVVKEGKAWKVFETRGGYLRNYYRWIEGEDNVICVFPLGRWINDKGNNYIRTEHGDNEYLQGFHLFQTRKEARKFKGDDKTLVLKRVMFKNVVVTGTELYGEKIIVARSIYVMSDTVN